MPPVTVLATGLTRRVSPPRLGLLLALLCASSAAYAQDIPWRPFTSVHTVCTDDPEVEAPEGCDDEAIDVLHLARGEPIRAWILKENPSFYLVVRHGELRAVDKQKVVRVQRSDSDKRPSADGHTDQVVLDSGHVLSGTVVQETAQPPHLEIRSPQGFTYTAGLARVVTVVRDGQEQQPAAPSP